jgi:ribonuclease J
MTEIAHNIEPTLGYVPGKDSFAVCPLGGSGEFGQNVMLFGHDGRWLMADCGLGFADENVPGVDIQVPDLEFIIKHKSKLDGLVITHAHEDHCGALPYLWGKLGADIYATPFVASAIKRKFSGHSDHATPTIHTIPLGGAFKIGPFSGRFISVAHSVPETSAIYVTCDAGRAVYAPDWRMDDNPVVGQKLDHEAFAKLPDNAVAFLGDSTRAAEIGKTPSESSVIDPMLDIIKTRRGRVYVTSFSSHISRMHTVSAIAQKTGRQAALTGRSMWRMHDIARENGYLAGLPEFLDDKMARQLPDDKVIVLCTGSQGQPRSALERLSYQDHHRLDIQEGDTVIFSSWTIPGNEKNVAGLVNRLLGLGAEVITLDDAPVHVSGHCKSGEIRDLYNIMRPSFVMPVHGDETQQTAHADLARDMGIDHLVPKDGQVIDLALDVPRVVAHVPSGILAVDGEQLVPLKSDILSQRRRLTNDGTAHVSVVMDAHHDLLFEPAVTIRGIAEDAPSLIDDTIDRITSNITQLPRPKRANYDTLHEEIRLAVRREIRDRTGKRPKISIHLFMEE